MSAWMWGRKYLLAAWLVLCLLPFPMARGADMSNDFEAHEFFSSVPKKKRKKVSAGIRYTVQKGDTLYSIARSHNVKKDFLAEANGLDDGKIKTGMVLVIPDSQKVQRPVRKRVSAVAGSREPSVRGTDGNEYIWPVRSVRGVVRDGGSGVRPIGVVISGNKGSRIVSSANGTVEKIGNMRGYGNFVVVKHKNRTLTVYSCLDSVVVQEGDPVYQGDIIGMLPQDSGTLKFMFHKSGKSVDPLKYLPPR